MADAVVSMVLGTFTDSVIQELKFLGGVGNQVRLAQTELQFMQGYLKDADARQQDNVVRIWVASITDAAYDLEDVIETFLIKVVYKRKGSVLKRFCRIFIEGVYLHQIGKETESITTSISQLRSSLPSYLRETRESESDTSFQRQRERRLAYPHVIEPHVVGLTARSDLLVEQLVKENRHRLVSIWGMGGLGKTTLAKQVYNHHEVKRHFDCFAWVCISQQCQGREVLEQILTKLISPTNEERQKIAKLQKDEIAEWLCNTQRERKCLVVLDDIWTRDAWNLLEVGFPMNEETESRILLTTRNKEAASSAGKNCFLYNPQLLNDDESWELFEKITLLQTEATNPETYERKKELGKKMLRYCGGLPLAVTVLGGLLARKDTVGEWDKVHTNFYAYIRRGTDLGPEYKGEEHEGLSWLLALSYDHLPYRLKLCFLYMAHYPEDYEIPVNSLTKLWIAEGFINSESGKMMEDVAYRCLSELMGRCMVQVGQLGSSDRIKTCRFHDLMRDLCLLKAKEVNFFQIVNYSATMETEEAPRGRVRRLAIHVVEKEDGSLSDHLPSHEGDVNLRSLVYFVPKYYGLLRSHQTSKLLKSLSNNFKNLRVLKFEGIISEGSDCKLPSKIGTLVHLRFLGLRNSNIRELPSSVANLVCMQTLDLRVYGRMEISNPKVFSRMGKLRHIYLPRNMDPQVSVSLLLHASNLQTIVNARIQSCDDLHDFAKLPNLKKLGVILEEFNKGTSFNLKHLESLSLEFNVYCSGQWDLVLSCPNIYKLRLGGNTIIKLPEGLACLKNLTKLILIGGFHLKDEDIKILEKLPSLRMFFLHGYTSCDQEFPAPLVCSKGGFQHLEYLSLTGLHKLKEWRVENGALPNLCRLHIEWCQELRQLPEGLQYITTLKELTILSMPKAFNIRVKEGGEDFYKIQHVTSVLVSQSWD